MGNTQLKGIRAKLYPTVKQQIYLTSLFGCARFVFNKCIDKSKQYYKEEKKSANLKMLGNYFHQELTKDDANSFILDHNTKVLKQEIINLLESYKHFFVNGFGFPKYKSRKDIQSLRFPLDAISRNTFTGKWRINLTKKLSGLKFKLSERDRKYIELGKKVIKSIALKRNKDNSYWVSILVSHSPIKKSINESTVGIDFGIKEFATVSNGIVHKNPRFYLKQEYKLKRLQRILSKKQKGSSNRYKAKLVLAKASGKIRRQRSDYIHNMTTKIINDNQVIIIESLNIKGMLKNHCLAKHIQDASISEAIRQFRYKCDWYGRDLVEVGRFYPSSKTCSKCGNVKKDLTLADRIYKCPKCGLVLDRDLNASINIRNEGIRISRDTLTRCGEDVRPKEIVSGGKPLRSRKTPIGNIYQ